MASFAHPAPRFEAASCGPRDAVPLTWARIADLDRRAAGEPAVAVPAMRLAPQQVPTRTNRADNPGSALSPLALSSPQKSRTIVKSLVLSTGNFGASILMTYFFGEGEGYRGYDRRLRCGRARRDDLRPRTSRRTCPPGDGCLHQRCYVRPGRGGGPRVACHRRGGLPGRSHHRSLSRHRRTR